MDAGKTCGKSRDFSSFYDRKSASLEVVQNIATALGVSYERVFKTEQAKDTDTNYAIHLLEKELIKSIIEIVQDKFDKVDL